jgi:hypothetical protein
MRKIFGCLLGASLMLGVAGCGGNQGGSVTENAEPSAVEAYQAAQEADQKAMEDMKVDINQ